MKNILQFGKAEIINIDAPTNIPTSQPFFINITIKNNDDYEAAIYLNVKHNQNLIEKIQENFQPQETKNYNLYFSDGITQQTTLNFEAGHLEPENICQWITDQNGPNLNLTDVFTIIDSYIFQTSPDGYSFIPTIQNVMGIIDYYLGFTYSGNNKTGCNF